MNKFLKGLKHTFIPHEHNGYQPHFFREISVISITIIIIALFSISASTILYIRSTDMAATVLPAVLVDLTNDARISNNKGILTRNSILDSAAQLKAEDMARLGYFAHTSPQGLTPWHWFGQAGYSFAYAGENLAINFNESIDVENAWLNSPTHKANILNSQFTEIGIATVDGIYQGYPTTYVVQMFGKPAKISINEASTPKPVTTNKTKTPLENKPNTVLATNVVTSPNGVKGESIAIENNLEIITDTTEFIAVKNIKVEEKIEDVQVEEKSNYSSWSQRFLFMTPAYTDLIYRIFIWIVLIALLVMIIFEIRHQNKKNIIYGVLLLVIMICLVYLNRTMFVASFLV